MANTSRDSMGHVCQAEALNRLISSPTNSKLYVFFLHFGEAHNHIGPGRRIGLCVESVKKFFGGWLADALHENGHPTSMNYL